jgi:hypothetical protein
MMGTERRFWVAQTWDEGLARYVVEVIREGDPRLRNGIVGLRTLSAAMDRSRGFGRLETGR